MRWLLVANGSAGQGTGRLLSRLSTELVARGHLATTRFRSIPSGLVAKLRFAVPPVGLWGALLRADVLAVHTSVALNLPLIVAARVLRRQVVVFAWDVYPGSLPRGGRARTVAYWVLRHLERAGLRLATCLVVPSGDYKPWFRAEKVVVARIWPSQPPLESSAREGVAVQGRLTVAFAGQINTTRGLDAALAILRKRVPDSTDIAVRVYSSEEPGPGLIPDGLRVEYRGYLTPEHLAEELQNVDFGLVCLQEDFQFPAYPSKLVNYVANGLPVLYFGPAMPELEEDLQRFSIGYSLRSDGSGPGPIGVPQGFVSGGEAYMALIRRGLDSLAEIH